MASRTAWLLLVVTIACLAEVNGRRNRQQQEQIVHERKKLPDGVKLRSDKGDIETLRAHSVISNGEWDKEGHYDSPWLLHVKGGHDSKVLNKVSKALGVKYKYIPHNTILVHANKTQVESVRSSMHEIVWASPLEPHHRVDPDLHPLMHEAEHPSRRRLLAKMEDKLELSVVMSKGDGGHEVAKHWQEVIGAEGMADVQVKAASHKKVIVVAKDSSMSSKLVSWLARQPHTLWVEARPKYKLLNKWAKGIMQSGNSSYTPFHDAGIKGEGQIVGIADTGISTNLCFFWDTDENVPYNKISSTHKKLVSYRTNFGDKGDDEGHGTHTTTSICGSADPEDLPKVAEYNGMAPSAKLYFDDIYQKGDLAPPDDLEHDLFPEPYKHGASIRSESWGGDSIFYTSSAMETDSFAYEHREFLVLWAAGNTGDDGYYTIGSPATGKNMLAVGAQYNALASTGQSDAGYRYVGIVGKDGGGFITEASLASFGSSEDLNGLIAKADPFDACNMFKNILNLQGKIIFVTRGTCTFTEKAIAVQNAGGIGMLLRDNEEYGSGQIKMAGEDLAVKITCISISADAGVQLESLLHGDDNVRLEWNPANHVSSDEDFHERLASFSSKGPTGDGRIKPEIVSVGNKIFSAKARTGENGFCKDDPNWATVGFEGTSMAAPISAGGTALLREYFMKGYFPSGKANKNNGWTPSGALLRAVILNGARPLGDKLDTTNEDTVYRFSQSFSQLPNNFQGFGSMRLNHAVILDPPSVGQPSNLMVRDDQGPFSAKCLETGDVWTRKITVKGGEPLRVTISWTDPPASLNSMVVLVNDLDLVVLDPNGKQYLGNMIIVGDQDGELRMVPDRLNNHEQVSFVDPKPGVYTVQVQGHTVPVNCQDFALAITGNFEEKGDGDTSCPSIGFLSITAEECNGSGTCNSGQCECNDLYAGQNCEVEIPVIKSGQKVSNTVYPYGWHYYAFDMGSNGGSFDIKFSRTGWEGDPDIYVMQGTKQLPTVLDYGDFCACPDDDDYYDDYDDDYDGDDYRSDHKKTRDEGDTCPCVELSCDACEDSGENEEHHLLSDPDTVVTGKVIIGVTGFCCEPADYELTVTSSKGEEVRYGRREDNPKDDKPKDDKKKKKRGGKNKKSRAHTAAKRTDANSTAKKADAARLKRQMPTIPVPQTA